MTLSHATNWQQRRRLLIGYTFAWALGISFMLVIARFSTLQPFHHFLILSLLIPLFFLGLTAIFCWHFEHLQQKIVTPKNTPDSTK